MTGKTHLLAGANAAGWLLLLCDGQPPAPWWIALGAISGLLPDLDASDSYIQQVGLQMGRHGPRLKLFKIPGMIFHALFGHRGFFHSLAALVILAAVYFFIHLPLEALLALAAGFGSHLFLDGLTIGGIPLFWPARQRVRLLPGILIPAKGLVDSLLFVVFSLGLAPLLFLSLHSQASLFR